MVDATRKGQTVEIGCTLSSEERQPDELVGLAREAENAGFAYALISDHYHPWTDKQGISPTFFVWSILAGIAEFVKAGFDHVRVHQVGPDKAGFMRFYQRQILPNVTSLAA
jgi:alkanesulfonate monooxygenase SsuD/methylene tetrahydromethanopterin reductase-like flavin-dependent oxidoreductase (luciferase family)